MIDLFIANIACGNPGFFRLRVQLASQDAAGAVLPPANAKSWIGENFMELR